MITSFHSTVSPRMVLRTGVVDGVTTTQALELPALQWADAKVWLPEDHQPGHIQRYYAVKWEHSNDTHGYLICYFQHGSFRYRKDQIETPFNHSYYDIVRWAPLY